MSQSNIITGQYVQINQSPASIGERIFGRLIDLLVLFCYVGSMSYLMNRYHPDFMGEIYYHHIFMNYHQMKLNVSDMKKTYQIPALYQDNVLDGCQLLVGTTIPVDPGDEGSQSQA